jgi:hypothetical protein
MGFLGKDRQGIMWYRLLMIKGEVRLCSLRMDAGIKCVWLPGEAGA